MHPLITTMELKLKMARKFNRFEQPKIVIAVIAGCFLAMMAFFALPKPVPLPSPTVSIPMSIHTSPNTQITQKSEEEAGQLSAVSDSIQKQEEAGQPSAVSDNIQRHEEVLRTKEEILTKEEISTNPLKSVGSDKEETSSIHLDKDAQTQEHHQRKPLCDLSDRRADLCEMIGDIRIHGNTSIAFLATPETELNTWRIKPYARKGDDIALSHVRELLISSKEDQPPACTHNHTVPAIIFSIRGYAGNIFHDFTDILIPLFLTSRQFDREVQFVISDMNIWWVHKYQFALQKLSRYPIIDLDKVSTDEVNCFPGAIVGLRCNKELSIDIAKSPNGYSMVDFTHFMRSALSLQRENPIRIKDGEQNEKKPRLLIIPRKRTRALLNVDEITRMAEEMGFEVVVAEPGISSDVAELAQVVNSCDVMMGVHGAGLTNLVYLPTTAVLIQIVPWGGLEWISMLDFGNPAKDMKLNYLQYSISAEESTLIDKFPRDHPVIRDPMRFHGHGWNLLRETFMDTQDVRLNLVRFRPVLQKALELLH